MEREQSPVSWQLSKSPRRPSVAFQGSSSQRSRPLSSPPGTGKHPGSVTCKRSSVENPTQSKTMTGSRSMGVGSKGVGSRRGMPAATRRTTLEQITSAFRQVPAKTIMELREVFKIADKDDGGSISTDELKYLLELVGLQLETADFNNLMKEIDEDGSGEIDLFEFVKMMTRKVEMNASEEQLNRAFKLFSHDDPPGTISMDHLKRLVTEFGPQHGVSDAQGVKLLKDLEAEMITLGGQFSTISEGADGRKQHFLKFPEYIPLMLAAQHKETKRRTISVGKGGYQGHDPDLGTSTIGHGSVKTFKRASVKR